MKKIALLLCFSFLSYQGICCTTCDVQVQQKIFGSTFYPNLFTILSAFIVLATVVALLAWFSNKRHTKFIASQAPATYLNPVPLTTAATILGMGIGGFIDGIVFHQILQWHEMISNVLPPVTLEAKIVNMFWDGIFHAFTLIVVVVGVVMLWKLLHRQDIDRSGKLFGGGLLVGAGIFNMVEGVIDHHLLKLHNVREITENVALWNYGFLVISLIMLLIGFILIRTTRPKVILK